MKTIHEEYAKLREDWLKTDDDTKLQQFFATEEYRAMSYIERNRGFITGSKAKIFMQDQWWYFLQYVQEMPKPSEDDTIADYFAIGLAVDEILTYGDDGFQKRFMVVRQRTADIQEAIRKCEEKIQKAKTMLKKDGQRDARGIKSEEEAMKKIEELMSMDGKVQITEGDKETVDQILKEYREHPLLDDKPKKKIVVFKLGEIACKAEFDNYIEHFSDPLATKGNDFHCIRDMKTCGNITTVEPGKPTDDWWKQLSFYQLALEEQTFKRKPVWDNRPICGVIDGVDKHSGWSRGRAFYYSPTMLLSNRQDIQKQIIACSDAMKTKKFYRSKDFMPDCPYYGVDGYGRDQSYFIVG